ncbi:MAG: heme-binding protein [Pedobacter sp.]|nr:MAG: heme-binding protein [Pedobacter sp.]
MKSIFLFLAIIPIISFAQNETKSPAVLLNTNKYVKSTDNFTLAGAFELTKIAFESAAALNKDISVAILDANGITILLVRGNNVGPHNTEASRRKAYTALSTKTPSFELMQKAAADATVKNLNTLPELLLLGGGVPIWLKGEVIGSIGISGAGGSLNDHNLAKKVLEKLGFQTTEVIN